MSLEISQASNTNNKVPPFKLLTSTGNKFQDLMRNIKIYSMRNAKQSLLLLALKD